MPHLKSGRVRALALVGAVRSKVLPDVPAFGEAGVPKLDTSGWAGMFAPAGTPRAIVDKVAADTQAVLALPEIADALRAQGLEPTGLGQMPLRNSSAKICCTGRRCRRNLGFGPRIDFLQSRFNPAALVAALIGLGPRARRDADGAAGHRPRCRRYQNIN